MINVDTLYIRIKDLARKDKGGYLDPDEFNRHLAQAQMVIYEYYFTEYESTQVVPDQMRPFVVLGNIALSASGLAALPADYKHHLRCNFLKIANTPGGQPVTTKIEAIPIEATEINLTISSPVRGPSVTKRNIYYRVAGEYVYVYNGGVPGGIEFEYLRTPDTPYRATTLDTANDEYNYSAGNSTQLEWDEYMEETFTEMLMYYYGLPTRQSEIIEWLAAKRVTKNLKIQ